MSAEEELGEGVLARITAIDDVINTAEEQVSRLRGRQEQILETLRKEFDCDSIEAARALRGKLRNEIDRKRAHLTQLLSDLEGRIARIRRREEGHE